MFCIKKKCIIKNSFLLISFACTIVRPNRHHILHSGTLETNLNSLLKGAQAYF